MSSRLTRRTFLWLSGFGGLSVLTPLDVTWVLPSTQSDAQRTLEALANVLLPGRGAQGTEPDEPGALDVQLYGQTFYEHLTDPYFSVVTNQGEWNKAAHLLDIAARCLAPFAPGFWALRHEKQLGMVALVSRREDEGEAPHLTPIQEQCLRLGGAEGAAPEIVFLRLFAGFLLYSSRPGLMWLRRRGYPGPNWGFQPTRNWAEMENPHLRDEDLDLFGGLIPSIAPGTLPPEFVPGTAPEATP